MSTIAHHVPKGCYLQYLAVVAVCVVIYWPGLGGGFFFDDGPSILSPPGVRLESLSWASLKQAWYSGGAGPLGRPIAQMSFAINYYLYGFSPFAFKATNLGIHCVCGVLVYVLSGRILNTANWKRGRIPTRTVAFVITSAWLVHPIQVLPVLHVVQRMTSLSAVFLFAALLLHVRERERVSGAAKPIILIAWLVLWPMSVLCKETGLLFPLFVVVWELSVRKNALGRLDIFARLLVGVIALLIVVVIGYMLSDQAQWLWAGYELRPFTMVQRLMTESRALWFYIGQIVFPRLGAFGVYHDDISLSTGWFSPWTTFPSSVGLIALLVLAWRLRTRAPLVTFGIAWFFSGHLLESSVFPLELVHEHRNYLPMLGILFVAAGAWNAAVVRHQPSARLVIALAIVVFGSATTITMLRAHQFGDEVRRTQLAALQHSSSARTQYEAGSILTGLIGENSENSPLVASAEKHFRASMDLDPDFKMGGLGLINLGCKVGKPPNPVDLAALMRRLQFTPFAPGDRNVLYIAKELANSGALCLNRRQIDGLFGAAVANPTVSTSVQAMILSWQADYLWITYRDMVAARQALSQSLAISPSNPSNRLKWAQLLYLSEELDSAGKVLLGLDSDKLSSEERRTQNDLMRSLNIEHQQHMY
jgi:hypothetical protein